MAAFRSGPRARAPARRVRRGLRARRVHVAESRERCFRAPDPDPAGSERLARGGRAARRVAGILGARRGRRDVGRAPAGRRPGGSDDERSARFRSLRSGQPRRPRRLVFLRQFRHDHPGRGVDAQQPLPRARQGHPAENDRGDDDARRAERRRRHVRRRRARVRPARRALPRGQHEARRPLGRRARAARPRRELGGRAHALRRVGRVYAGHTRFATTSKATFARHAPAPVDAAARARGVARLPRRRARARVARCHVENFVCHNGDLDFFTVGGKTFDLGTVQEWLRARRARRCRRPSTRARSPASSTCCAPRAAGSSARASACTSARRRRARRSRTRRRAPRASRPRPRRSRRSSSSSCAPRAASGARARCARSASARARERLAAACARPRRTAGARAARCRRAEPARAVLQGGESASRRARSATATKSRASLRPSPLPRDAQASVDAFFDNDLLYAARLFLGAAKGSFGLCVSSSLDAHRQIVVAARGQTISVAFYPRQGLVLYGSEAAAVKAAVGVACPPPSPATAAKKPAPRDYGGAAGAAPRRREPEAERADVRRLGRRVRLARRRRRRRRARPRREQRRARRREQRRRRGRRARARRVVRGRRERGRRARDGRAAARLARLAALARQHRLPRARDGARGRHGVPARPRRPRRRALPHRLGRRAAGAAAAARRAPRGRPRRPRCRTRARARRRRRTRTCRRTR